MKKSLSIKKLVSVSLAAILMTALFALPVAAVDPTSTATSADQELTVSMPSDTANNSVSPGAMVEAPEAPSVADEGDDVLPEMCPCLLAKAAEEGQVLVIVGLRPPTGTFSPEGDLASAAAVDVQRDAIATAREALLGSLAGYNAEAYASWNSMPYVAMKVDATALEQLANSPYVTNVQEDSLSEPALASTTAHIGADDTWDAGFGGLGRTVVILDTGIDANHPFFGGRVVAEACWSNAGGAGSGTTLCPNGANSQTGLGSADALTAQCMDGANCICDHGTHVAGIAAGQDPGGAGATGYSGVAPEANIIAIQVFTRIADCDAITPGNQPCVKTYSSDQISALNYVNNVLRLSWDIDSINLSLGGGENTAACDGDARKAPIDNLLSNGIATVIASGNNGWTDALNAPGCISTAVTVGTVYDGNPCGTFDEVSHNMHSVVDLLAVGKCVDSSVPDDAWGLGWGGTSMATPQVTGAFAMLRSIDPSMSIADILDLLKTTGVLVRDNRAPNPADANAGHVKPRIQLDAAVASLTEANLRVFKDCKPDRPMLVGDTATCTITVQNLGPDPALSVMVVDEYLSDGTFNFGTVTCSAGTCTTTGNPQVGAGTVTCDLGAMGPGDSVTIKVPVTADEPQDINDRVTVSSITPDPDPDNNVAEDSVTVSDEADLNVVKDCKPDGGVLAGEEATCTILVDNLGPSTASNVVLTDTYLSDGDFTFGTISTDTGSCSRTGNVVTCNLGDLAPQDRATVTVVVSAEEGQDINNHASVTSDNYDPDQSNNYAEDSVRVVPVADLEIAKTDVPDPVVAGTALTYTLTVMNTGPSTATNVVVRDWLPADVTIDSLSPSAGSVIAGEPGDALQPTVWNVGSMLAGASRTMIVDVTVVPQTAEGTLLQNDSDVSSAVLDPDNSDNIVHVSTTVVSRADLVITKTDLPDPVVAGEQLTYEVSITNNGPSTARDVTLCEELPSEVTFVDASISNGGTWEVLNVPPVTVVCQLDDLDPGESVSVFVTVLVDPSVLDGSLISNTATASSSTVDPDATNNVATQETTVNAEADLNISKDASVLTSNPAPRVTYTLTVLNNGPSDAQNVVVVDTLPLDPKKVIYVMDSGNGNCTYFKTPSPHHVTWNVGTLKAGETRSVQIVVDVRGSVGVISNYATVTSTTFDPILTNNTVRKDVRIKGGPGKK